MRRSLGLAIAGLLALCTPARAVEPGEVANLLFVDKETLSWDAEPLADSYNLYRGYLMDLDSGFYGTFLTGELAGTSHVDPTTPIEHRGFFYLVTAANVDGEGTSGADGNATPRPNNFPWPGLGVAGRWENFRAWPVQAIHTAVMHTGTVITWGYGGDSTSTYVWDPQTDLFDNLVVTPDLFCSGHTLLPDGRLLVVGGRSSESSGHNLSRYFDPVALAWSHGPDMAQGRWYPTATAMGDGTALVFSGNLPNAERNEDVELFELGPGGSGNASFTVLPGASKSIPLYPRMHLLPSGEVFRAGPGVTTDSLDPVSQTWSFVAGANYGFRGEGTSVTLPPGHERIMIVGGRDRNSAEYPLATNTAEIIDLSNAAPSWSYTIPMTFPRMHANAVILPDGRVIVAGGGYDDDIPAYPSEIFDPASDTWTMAAVQRSFRLYHSTAVLLPDGQVMWAGSNGNTTAEFYKPGYFFRGPRPTISSAPSSIRYGNTFSLGTPDANAIDSVVLIRGGSVTHSVNMGQRYVALSFSVASATSLDVTAPPDGNVAPPGYYMLFILDGDEVPSEAVFVELK